MKPPARQRIQKGGGPTCPPLRVCTHRGPPAAGGWRSLRDPRTTPCAAVRNPRTTAGSGDLGTTSSRGRIVLCCRGRPCALWDVCSIPGLCPLHASKPPLVVRLGCDNQIWLQTLPDVPWAGAHITPIESQIPRARCQCPPPQTPPVRARNGPLRAGDLPCTARGSSWVRAPLGGLSCPPLTFRDNPSRQYFTELGRVAFLAASLGPQCRMSTAGVTMSLHKGRWRLERRSARPKPMHHEQKPPAP